VLAVLADGVAGWDGCGPGGSAAAAAAVRPASSDGPTGFGHERDTVRMRVF
jgi:hypothetical protein